MVTRTELDELVDQMRSAGTLATAAPIKFGIFKLEQVSRNIRAFGVLNLWAQGPTQPAWAGTVPPSKTHQLPLGRDRAFRRGRSGVGRRRPSGPRAGR
jgi:hypothetical protein